MSLHIEQMREYVADFRTPATEKFEVCVDGRTPRKDAGKIARGGATHGIALDIIDALAYQGISYIAPEEVVRRMIRIAQRNDGGYTYHTDTHAAEHAPLNLNPGTDPIGCKYAAVMREHSDLSRRAHVYALTSSLVERVVLEGQHEEAAVVIIDDEDETIPHQVEGGPMIFKWDRMRDEKRRELYIAQLEIDGLDPTVVSRTAFDNVVETLAHIPGAQGLGMFRVSRHNGELVTESAGTVGA